MTKSKLSTLAVSQHFETCLTGKAGLVLGAADHDGLNLLSGAAGPHRRVLLTWNGPGGVEQERKVCHGDVLVLAL